MIVGNPKLDLARYLKNSNITFKKKTIGVATRFQVLNNQFGRPLIFSLAHQVSIVLRMSRSNRS